MAGPQPSSASAQVALNPNILRLTLDDGEKLKMPVEPRDVLAHVALRNANPAITHAASSDNPCILSVKGIIGIELDDGRIGALVAKLNGHLIKRELIADVGDEFHCLMTHINPSTTLLARQLFDRQGTLRPEFQGRGIWGTNSKTNEDAWVFEISALEVSPRYRRQGIGSALAEFAMKMVLAWATEKEEELERVVLNLVHLKGQPDAKCWLAPETHSTRKSFWRSLGFRRLSARSSWFGWARSVAAPDAHPPTGDIEWESDDD